jgi:hypothetical protein
MSQTFEKYLLKNNLYCGFARYTDDPAYGYTTTKIPNVKFDPTVNSWRWTGSDWEMITVEEWNRIMNEE